MKSPFGNVNIPWTPRVSYVLAGLEIYDREDEIGGVLRKYDPNLSRDRQQIIEKYISPELEYLSYRHRFALMKVLEEALADQAFDFPSQFASDFDECFTFAWNEEEISDSRGFFEDIYKFLNERWKDDLRKASLEDRSTW